MVDTIDAGDGIAAGADPCAQLDSIRTSRVKAMDETPIKAGRAGPGKMKAAYFWPVYGEQDEICFLYYPVRLARHWKPLVRCTRSRPRSVNRH